MANNLNDKLDQQQVIKSVYDTDDNSLRVSVVSGSGGGGGVSVEIDAAEDSIAIGDGTKLATITTVGPKNALDVNVASISGDIATETTLSSIDSKVIVADTDNVTVTSSVLPSGAATSALQTTGNASLASIDTKLTSPLTVTGPLTDTQLRATPIPVSGTIDLSFASLSALESITVQNPGGAGAVNIQDGGNSITVDQGGTWNINDISGTVSLPAGAATAANQTTANASLSSIDAGIPASLGQTTMSASMPVVISSDQIPQLIPNIAVNNTAIPTSSALIGGSDGTNIRPILTSTNGTPYVSITSPNAAPYGIYSTVNPDGSLNVQSDGSELFTEYFEGSTLDTTNKWTLTVTNGGTEAVTSGQMQLNTGTTASRSAAINTQATFSPRALSFEVCGMVIKLEASVVTNTHRFWGLGTPNASFTATTPLANAIGFEIDTSGVLRASIYQANTRVFTQILTVPTDGQFHRYGVRLRADVMFFFFDDLEIPMANSSYIGPDVINLPVRMHMINHTTPPAATPTYISLGVGVTDGGHNNISLSDGTYPWRKAKVDTVGAVSITNGERVTYSASVVALAVASSATDIFTITGSATKTVRITRIQISGIQSTAANIDTQIIKRSTANSGGTSAARTAVPHDSANAAATATVLSYTANPTLGTAVGTIRSNKSYISLASGNGNVNQTNVEYTFGDRFGAQAITLRGTSQVLAINLNGTTVIGSSIDIDIEWTEES